MPPISTKIVLYHIKLPTHWFEAAPNSPPSNNGAVAPTNIWYDDCSDISTWHVENTSTLGVQWAVSYDPSAIPSADVSPIASSTAANGYMFVNSDADGGATDGDGTTIETTFTNATLADSGYVTGSSGQRILTGQAMISGQPSGQSMRWKLALANNGVKIHGVALQWS